MQDMFKGNVSMQDTHTQIMSSCKTLQFRKTCLLSLVGRHDLVKDMSSCLKMHFYCFYFLCFILLKTCLFPRHVLNMAPRHDFYSVSLIMVTITSHIFTAIFPREYLLAIQFLVDTEKNMGHLLIPKSQKVWEKVEKIGLWTPLTHVNNMFHKKHNSATLLTETMYLPTAVLSFEFKYFKYNWWR